MCVNAPDAFFFVCVNFIHVQVYPPRNLSAFARRWLKGNVHFCHVLRAVNRLACAEVWNTRTHKRRQADKKCVACERECLRA